MSVASGASRGGYRLRGASAVWRLLLLFCAVGLGVGACTDEAPTAIGGDLLRGGAVRTVEIILGPDDFLVGDTAITGFVRPDEVGFVVVAREFGDTLDAHALARFGPKPDAVAFEDTAGVTQRDTTPDFVGAELLLPVDTVLSDAAGPVRFRLFRIAGEWDSDSVEWPGPETGALVDEAAFAPASDSVLRFDVDSATVAAWTDTTSADGGGALVVAETRGVRLRATGIQLQLLAKVSDPDTVVAEPVTTTDFTFIFEPLPDQPDHLRVGGVPSWRAYLRIQDDIGAILLADSLRLPCPDATDDCEVRLYDATLNYAALQLTPVSTRTAFQPTDSVRVQARPVLETGLAPLGRSPLARSGSITCRRGPCDPVAIPPARFDAGTAGQGSVELPITSFIADLVQAADPAADPAEDEEGEEGAAEPPSTLALLLFSPPQAPLVDQFGFGSFAARGAGPAAPRLRIVLTVASDIGIQ